MSEPAGRGFAVARDDKVLVRTVSDTRRKAIMKYLKSDMGLQVFQTWTDGDIEAIWRRCNKGAKVVPVTIDKAT